MSCCGPVGERVSLIRQVVQATSDAHRMLADLYDTLAKDLPEESSAFLKAAEKQRRLSRESLEITLPDEVEVGSDEAGV